MRIAFVARVTIGPERHLITTSNVSFQRPHIVVYYVCRAREVIYQCYRSPFPVGGKMTREIRVMRRWGRGVALIVSLVFVLIFSALAVSMAGLTSTNAQVASNLRQVNGALSAAQSGHEVVRYCMSQITIPGLTPPSQRYSYVMSALQSISATSQLPTTLTYDAGVMTVPSTILDSSAGRTFSAQITQIDQDTLQVDVQGSARQISRTISTRYAFGTREDSVFDFGVATRGPLSLSGNILLDGVNVSVESDVYIESPNSNLALDIIGNSQIAGEVKIVNPDATVDLQGGQAGIGGETGDEAIDNHVEFGAPETQFPVPYPQQYEHLATNIIDDTTDTSSDIVLENVKVVAGTNPTFSGHATLKGIVYVEAPNVVTFTGTADIIGIVVAEGELNDNSGTNQLVFQGDVISQPVTALPDEDQFDEIRDETGGFVIAPGFSVAFGGSFDTLNGAIAANGVNFFGNAGGTVNGSIINYSDTPMDLGGNSDLFFNRSGTDSVPAGFAPEIVLNYSPESYSESTSYASYAQ